MSIHVTNQATFATLFRRLAMEFNVKAKKVHQNSWQGIDVSGSPGSAAWEVTHVSFEQNLLGTENLQIWRDYVSPNLPWADDHFEERVCGYPVNPGTTWKQWPWSNKADQARDPESGTFNHNYMERYWPRFAHISARESTHTPEDWEVQANEIDNGWTFKGQKGIRSNWGDLNDLVNEIVKDPLSRQHYLPIFFPEDVGEVLGGRKPCTLGYHFLIRNNRMDVFYPMRSTDFLRHLNDDIYLTIRLLIWVLERCREKDESFNGVKPGKFLFHTTSLHVFENDLRNLSKKYGG